MMTRFFRIVLFLMGLLLYVTIVVRMVQPADPDQNYVAIVGNRPGGRCCYTYMVNPAKNEAHRVRLSVIEQPVASSSISPSGRWRYAHVQTQTGRLVYLIRLDDDGFLRLPDHVGKGRYVHWDSQDDVLYFIGRGPAAEMALHRLTPQNPEPERLTDYTFQDVRAIHQQPLPHLPDFAPWLLAFWTITALVLAGALRPRR